MCLTYLDVHALQPWALRPTCHIGTVGAREASLGGRPTQLHFSTEVSAWKIPEWAGKWEGRVGGGGSVSPGGRREGGTADRISKQGVGKREL